MKLFIALGAVLCCVAIIQFSWSVSYAWKLHDSRVYSKLTDTMMVGKSVVTLPGNGYPGSIRVSKTQFALLVARDPNLYVDSHGHFRVDLTYKARIGSLGGMVCLVWALGFLKQASRFSKSLL